MPEEFIPPPAALEPDYDKDTGQTMPMYEDTLAKAAHQNAAMSVAGSGIHNPSVTELLHMKKSNLEREIDLVNKALKIAEEQSGAMSLIDAISKTRVHG